MAFGIQNILYSSVFCNCRSQAFELKAFQQIIYRFSMIDIEHILNLQGFFFFVLEVMFSLSLIYTDAHSTNKQIIPVLFGL